MFFIGGFNSVIPYVIYLSLIWMFVILSFGGKIATMLHRQPDNEASLSEMITRSADDHILQCYHYVPLKQSHFKTINGIPDLQQLSCRPSIFRYIRIRYVSPPLPSTVTFSFLFRGPPLYS